MASPSSVLEEHYDVSIVVGLANIPEEIRSHDTLVSPDYSDAFTVTRSRETTKSPEEWARAGFEETPLARRFASLAWGMLGLRVGPLRSPGFIHGWKIADGGDDWIRLENASWFMTTHLVLKVYARQVSFALFVRYDRRIAAVIWPPFSVVHRQAGRALIGQVAKLHGETG
jgi:hypothetical protein